MLEGGEPATNTPEVGEVNILPWRMQEVLVDPLNGGRTMKNGTRDKIQDPNPIEEIKTGRMSHGMK